MSFSPRMSRQPSPGRSGASVLAIGRRVFVSRSADGPSRVALTDDGGRDSRTTLADGTEVEIVAWLPRGPVGARYRVRATSDGTEGWLAATNLRSSVTPVPAPPTPAPAAAAPDPAAQGRRFGQRK